jgi:hypothetical protein
MFPGVRLFSTLWWFMSIQDCLRPTSNWKKHPIGDVITGYIKTDVVMDTEAIIGPAISL